LLAEVFHGVIWFMASPVMQTKSATVRQIRECFYNASPLLATPTAVRSVCLSVCLSVRPSVTFRFFVPKNTYDSMVFVASGRTVSF